MSNLAYKEIIDSVGEQIFTNVDDIIAKGGKIITSSNGTQLGVFNGGKALNFTSGAGQPLSNASGLSAISSNSVVSTVTSNTSAGIATKALGVASWVGKALMAFGIGYAGGIALGETLNETESGRKFLTDYYNFFTGQDNAVDDNVAGFVNEFGTFYTDAKAVNNAFDYLHASGAYGKTIGKQNIQVGAFNPSELTFDKDLVLDYTFEALELSRTLNATQKNILEQFKTFIKNYDIDYSLENTFTQYDLTFHKNGESVGNIFLNIRIWTNINEITFPNGITRFPSNPDIIEFRVESNGTKERIIRFDYANNKMMLSNDEIRDFSGFYEVRNYIPPLDTNNYVEIVNYGFETVTIPGITKLPNATIPNKTGTLEERFPEWWSKRIEITQPDGSVSSYVPLTLPNTDNLADLKTIPQANAQEGLISPDNEAVVEESVATATEIAVDEGVEIPTNNPNDNTGNTPVIVPPIGVNATGFVALYSPTKQELKQFNNYLWSLGTDPVDAISRLFQNPMDAIIGLHQIYAPAPTYTVANIRVGLLDSGVSSRICNEQYVSIDFGSITINEYFGNVLDYTPYTNITMYLPFIGYVELRTEDVMKSIVSLKYNIDLLTGSCVAIINVKKDNMNADLYSFNGNCAIQLPITGANYSGILSTILSAGLAIATKGATASMGALGVVSSIAHGSNIPIIHGNNATSNYGAMSGKTPFIIINRQSDVSPYNFNNFFGYASSKTTKLSKLSGYTKVKDVHLDNVNNATDEELDMIYNLLTGGIII